MIQSMTAFSRGEQSEDWGSLTWELKSVNHRYLEPTFRLPDPLRSIEPDLRDCLKRQSARGKFDCTLKLIHADNSAASGTIDPDCLRNLLASCTQLTAAPGNWSPLNPLELLAWPGVLREPPTDEQRVASTAIALFQRTLSTLTDNRKREGAQLCALLEQRLAAMEPLIARRRRRAPELLAEQQLRIRRKLEELKLEANPDRLEQELVLIAQRADVLEELDRLDTHITEVRRILARGGHCGRRLDFLMQELNREANTLAAKSLSADATQDAVELKVLIEQMREQVQNIE